MKLKKLKRKIKGRKILVNTESSIMWVEISKEDCIRMWKCELGEVKCVTFKDFNEVYVFVEMPQDSS